MPARIRRSGRIFMLERKRQEKVSQAPSRSRGMVSMAISSRFTPDKKLCTPFQECSIRRHIVNGRRPIKLDKNLFIYEYMMGSCCYSCLLLACSIVFINRKITTTKPRKCVVKYEPQYDTQPRTIKKHIKIDHHISLG